MRIRYLTLSEEEDAAQKTLALKTMINLCIRLSPRDKKIKAISKARELLQTINPKGTYVYSELYESVMGYPLSNPPHFSLNGAITSKFLVCFMESISACAELGSEDLGSETLYDSAQLSALLNISTKTIDRYRDQGLLPSTIVRIDGRQKMIFLPDDVEHLKRQLGDKLEKASQFSFLSDDEKQIIRERGKELYREGIGPTETAKTIAKEMRRSVEAIRYTLKKTSEKKADTA